MAVRRGLWDLSNPRLLVALLLGLGLLAGGGYMIWLHRALFGEIGTPGPPDGARVAALGGRIRTVSPLLLVVEVAILLETSLLATG